VYAYYDCIDDDTDIYYGRDSDVPACRDDAAIDTLAALVRNVSCSSYSDPHPRT